MPIKAKGKCPQCEGSEVYLKHGFCWKCRDCGAEIARDYYMDKEGWRIQSKRKSDRGTYTWGEEF